MNPEEFLNYTSQTDDDESIQYILDSRYNEANGVIEYLVRYNDPNCEFDEWVRSTDLICTKKIIDYINGNIPPNIEKRERKANQEVITPPDSNDKDEDKFKIYGVASSNNNILLNVHLPNHPGIVTKNSNELIDQYRNEIIEFYEKHCFE